MLWVKLYKLFLFLNFLRKLLFEIVDFAFGLLFNEVFAARDVVCGLYGFDNFFEEVFVVFVHFG